MELLTKININATPEVVWKELINFSNYKWNPFIKSISGDVKKGNTIKVELGGMTFKPLVLKYESPKELRWKGKLFFKGLFDGEHYFQLQEQSNGETLFTHGEKFSGLLVPLLKGKIEGETLEGFKAMNLALKKRCEEIGID